ncbi:MAG: aspartyl-phosphate phosphatase Spo0E family protein [Bacillus sp. (in: Bacteria)]|nr:aspartyl-phosphate phosphatase Spo0E family protein [Bacillus sp. (in: firmicutes)]
MGNKKQLLKQMEEKRIQMMRSAINYGFTAEQTIQYSQELDHLMNLYDRMSITNSKETKPAQIYLNY